METLVQSLVSGILTGSLYAMIGVGLTIIFGVMRIINMAHGDMVMLGMYSSFWALTLWHIDPFVSIILWVPVAFLIGMLTYRFLLKKIVPAGELNTLLYTAVFHCSYRTWCSLSGQVIIVRSSLTTRSCLYGHSG